MTIKLKLHKPTLAKQRMYQEMADRCTAFANRCLQLDKKDRPKTSKQARQYSEKLPSAVLAQAIRDIRAAKKAKRFKRLWPNFNSQNFRVEKEASQNGGAVWKASFPTLEKRVGVPVEVSAYQEKYLEMPLSGQAKQGTARLVRRGKEWFIHLSLTMSIAEEKSRTGKIMGIDLGQIDLLVATVAGQTLFFSGAPLAYIRRRFARLRHSLQKARAYRAIKRLGDKEHRWVTDVNHKISRVVVKFAKSQGVILIRMENLKGVRWTTRQRKVQKRDHGRNLDYWPYYQLQQFIKYKAALAGTRVEFVNRDNTSLTCSRCGETVKSRPQGRWFKCPRCKETMHVDANAASNIAQAISGLAA
ncbi:IS200/IS605 family transposase ISHarch20 [Moorella thermoacetica]|uniref:IS200/IS605 family transposase ISHarch20 n=1 Tax=Neomoorella thermoacetica TaxID=1525 RepID=A0AAC9HFW5_NEOTH|nr:RNA-guided endonuclease TnpB family protein [Moorella thermoacetica]AOQ23059.1 Putative transposase DNA-binding domain protein [Moorella thermoacetica]TYL08974.1 IS200/IS605 family transposase ISHarch20 [Moorella thermoacetica]